MVAAAEPGGTRSKILRAAAELFLSIGFEKSTISKIADTAEASRGSVCFFFKDKEALLCELVTHMLDRQYFATKELLKDKTEDPILFYAAETVLQLHLAENSEQIREMYNISYSMKGSPSPIFYSVTSKLERLFGQIHPQWQTRDFYEREISTAGIMRNHMSVPCDMYFTMERKIRVFLESALLVMEVPREKIEEAINFVMQFDWNCVATSIIDNMLPYLESKI